MKRKTATIILTFTFTVTAVLITGCATLGTLLNTYAPRFKLESFKMSEVQLDGVTFRADALLENPYPVALPKSNLDFDLKINDQKLSAVKSIPISVAAGGSTSVPLDIKITWKELSNLLGGNLALKDGFKLGLDGNVAFPVQIPGGGQAIKVPLNIEKRVPIFIPDVKLENFTLKKPDLMSGLLGAATGSGAIESGFDLVIANKAASLFTIKEMNYNLDLADKSFLKGGMDSLKKEENGVRAVVRASLPIKNATSALLSLLNSRAASGYSLKGNSMINFAGYDIDSFDYPINLKGNLNW